MNIDAVCSNCGNETETTSHLLIHCPAARHTWAQSPIRAFPQNHRSTFKEVCTTMFENLPLEGSSLFAILAWNIWKARNKRIFENIFLEPREVVCRSLRLFQDLRAHSNVKGKSLKKSDRNIAWIPPPQGLLKINSDVAVFGDGQVGLGFVIRNSRGDVMMSGVKRCKADGDSTLLEALALRFAMRQAIDGGLHRLMIETDSEILANSLRDGRRNDSVASMIMEDIWDLANEIGCTQFLYVKREANSLAHNIAHFSCNENYEEVWIKEVPPCCNRTLLKDVRREPIFH